MKNKTYLKTVILAVSLVFAFVIAIGKGTDVSAEETIVPTYVEANGSTANANTYQFQMTNETAKRCIPIQISRGGVVWMDVSVQTSANTFGVVLSKNASPLVQEDWLSYSLETKAKLSAYAQGACTWYLHLVTPSSSSDKNAAVTVKAYQNNIPAGDGALKKGQWASYFVAGDDSACYQIKVPSSGSLCVEISEVNEDDYLRVSLLNSKKKELADETSFGGELGKKAVYYGVKKGTYYIKIKNSMMGKAFKIRYTFEKVAINKNTKQSKAISLKSGKTSKGVFVDKDKNSSHWYKITLTKNKKVKFNIPVKAEDENFSLDIYKENGKQAKSLDLKTGKNQLKVKMKKGTYYIRMVSYLGGGSYSIQWK